MYIKKLNALLSSGSKHHDSITCEQYWKRFLSSKALQSEIHKCTYKNNLDLPENMHIKDNKLFETPVRFIRKRI